MRNTQRLDKIVSNFGYGTRKEIKAMVKNGLIKVDGQVARDSGIHVDPNSSVIEINGEVLNYKEFIYLMLNKPQGVISATFDQRHKTVVELMPEEVLHYDLFPVGRLDIDTEGLLIMTNDGELAHEVLSPKKHVKKKYYALIDGNVTESDKDEFSKGITLDDGYKTMPALLHIIRSGSISEIELSIVEGKFHQVKRMFEALGKEVKFLKRIEMGGILLDESLKPGECRELTDEELTVLRNSAGKGLEEKDKDE
ncbi:pseudouridine synthase [Pseudobacteroides cellulosolvens]|uniref:Pseudouridine synthase n=1 Tax=Pseudobacteroides cellulosolvens ATCC 35603 = DSM 2933 TaxID=398512 RepID=A0A0L6JLI1_9FIRM|nr:pseudouridine synthase [Pseudobacteroides cellulosolvens]KNY26624.1 pseudouridine synthase Rsu [Pseudobacteroides cellulosolvens ATCC 35603 = DSM 2933]